MRNAGLVSPPDPPGTRTVWGASGSPVPRAVARAARGGRPCRSLIAPAGRARAGSATSGGARGGPSRRPRALAFAGARSRRACARPATARSPRGSRRTMRATAGVLPSSSPTRRITAARIRRSSRRRLGGPALGETARGRQRAAPGAEVLRRESLSEVLADVVVEQRRRQVRGLALAIESQQSARRRRSAGARARASARSGIDDRRSHGDPVLPGEAEADPATANRHVALAQGRDAVGAARAEMPLGADPEPGAVDQT